MELFLNIAWILLAGLLFGLWQHCTPRKGTSRTMQLVALAMLVLILFPVISVTDDLQAAQNLAETDCCQRRVHACSPSHSIVPTIAALPPAARTGLSFGPLGLHSPRGVSALFTDHPALSPIQNRPPPMA
jgi:hypothetical protein